MKGWESSAGEETTELKDERLQELQDEAFSNYIETVLPLLKDRQLTVKLIGEEKVDGKAAVGVKVSAKDRKDIKLFFDKESGLLAKLQRRTTGLEMKEVDSETF